MSQKSALQQRKTNLTDTALTRRLYLTGLASTIKPKDLVDRFASFGNVVGGETGIEGLGLDANGSPRRSAFLTLESTEIKLSKCISMLSGATWKGSKLKITSARPDYRERLEAERKAANVLASKAPARKKRKHSSDPNIGMLASHFEVVDVDNIERHKGWTLDQTGPTPLPLFPIVTRPAHPLPPIPKAAQTAWSREAPKAKASKAARAALKQSGGQPVNPLVRARRIRIDPRKWGRRKIIYDETSAEAERRAAGIWECEDVIDENGEAKAIWVFKSKDGNVRRRDIVNLTRRSTPHTDRFTALLEGLNRPVTHPEPGLTNRQSSPIIHDPQFPTVDIEHTKERLSKRRKSLSPPPYIPSAPRTLLYNDEDTFALLESTQDSEELEATRKRERAKQLELLASLLTESEVPATAERSTIDQKFEVVAIEKPRLTSRGRVEGYAEDSDDEDFFKSLKRTQAAMQSTRLTLRGGAASPSSDESTDSDFDSESTDGREEGDDRDADAVANVGSTAKSMKDIKMQPVRPKTMLVKGSLKDMFKPKEKEAESSFSLLSGLDLELDPLERTPSPPPAPRVPQSINFAQKYVAPPPSFGKQQIRPTGPITPFFAFPLDIPADLSGETTLDSTLPTALDVTKISALQQRTLAQYGRTAADCWRTESSETIETKHQALRDSLRGVARKRHREAAKRTRSTKSHKKTVDATPALV